jgi:hypothetical protein
MKKLIILTVLLLQACTTPQTVLKNDKTGQIARCGGNVAVIGILYPFMLNADYKCVQDYLNEGFKKD